MKAPRRFHVTRRAYVQRRKERSMHFVMQPSGEGQVAYTVCDGNYAAQAKERDNEGGRTGGGGQNRTGGAAWTNSRRTLSFHPANNDNRV